jgi:hypothetical protein
MLEALVGAVNERQREEVQGWTTDRELLAVIAELLHSLVQVTLRVNGAKNVGPPLRIPRPGEEPYEEPKKPAVSFGQFARDVKAR